MKLIKAVRYDRYSYLALAIIVLSFISLINYFLYFSEDAITETNESFKYPFAFFTLIGLFLGYFWLKSFFTNPAIFSIYDEGFESNTNGVSSGFIRWDEVERFEVLNIKYGRGYSDAIAVYFKRPDLYDSKQPLLIRILREIASWTGVFKKKDVSNNFDEGMPYLIPYDALGREKEQIVKLILDLLEANKQIRNN